MDEKFIIVSGKDRLCLSKGVDAVHKVKEEGNGNSKNQRGSTSSRRSRSRSPADGGRAGSRTGRSEPPRSSGHSPRKTTQLPQKFGRPEKVVEEHIREDVQKFSRGSPRGRDTIEFVYPVLMKLVNHIFWSFFFPWKTMKLFFGFQMKHLMIIVAYHFCFAARGKLKHYVFDCEVTFGSIVESVGLNP